jgi:hypothetical protein
MREELVLERFYRTTDQITVTEEQEMGRAYFDRPDPATPRARTRASLRL